MNTKVKKETKSTRQRRAAHFLLIPELLYSPPNHAIITAYLENKYSVDVFSPGNLEKNTLYGDQVRTYKVSYSWYWILQNIFNIRWLSYNIISGTSEDPLVTVGLISFLYHKKNFALVDEIKAGSYRGDRSERWKSLCKWTMRISNFCIVNDRHRIGLLREYAHLNSRKEIVVYPGCFVEKPIVNEEIHTIKSGWGFPGDAFVIGSSGGFNLTAGADWLLSSLRDMEDMYAVIQPLGVSELSMYLMENLDYKKRLYIQRNRLSWYEAWKKAKGFDVGLSIYTNSAPQFQKMGISSNRLCMFIAMGVPVIASKQKSFEFLEYYDCGIMVETYDEFKLALKKIRTNNIRMKANCKKCHDEYIQVDQAYHLLSSAIGKFSRS